MRNFWPIIFLLTGILEKCLSSVPVIDFQKDGSFRSDTFLKRSGKLGDEVEDNISELTLCLRVSVFHLRGRLTTFLSYGNIDSPDALTGFIQRRKFDLPYTLAFCKHKFMHNECIEYVMKGFEFFKWYHICLIYEDVPMESVGHKTLMSLYINGKNVKQTTTSINGSLEFISIKRDGILVLGQEQDSLGGFFDEDQSFCGKLSQVEMWSMKLDGETIESLSNCLQQTAFVQSRVVTWNGSLEEWNESNVDKSLVQLQDLCIDDPLLDYLIWADQVSYTQISDYCRRLDGELPEIKDASDLEKVHEIALKRFKTSGDALESCLAGNEKVKFWIKDANVSAYADVSDYECPYVFGDRIEKGLCQVKFPCGLCKLPKAKRLLIKGVCGKDAEYNYDFDFGVHGTLHGRAIFRGSQNSYMYFDPETQKWRLQSLRNPSKYIQTVERLSEELPIGTHNWEVMSEEAICKLKNGQILELTMSQCYPNMYTCNNGDCIELSSKCDTDFDCHDKSDEYYCDYLRFGENYAKELIPRDESGKALIVYMNVSVLAFPFIETVNLKFTADFFLNLKWYDLRIDFRDLNNVTSLNTLSRADQDAIWTPKLGFTNALGPFQTQVDRLTSGVLVREDDPIGEDITQSTESMLFSGRKNAIYLSREYYQEYACDFDLLYYPFDTQLCVMIFEVQGKTDNYIRLSKDGPGIEFLSSRELVEYEIQMEALQFRSVNNISQGVVKFVFRRRMEFHVTNTFLQTFILVFVGYFSYFFDVDNFSDRIMVVLTTMLVVATVTTSIQTSLPKTSYYKMIDWWLLISLNILVITMLFHTFLAHVVSKAQKRPIRVLSAKSVFSRLAGGGGGNHKDSSVSSGPGITSVETQQPDIYGRGVGQRPKTSMSFAGKNEEDTLAVARRWNHFGKVTYVVLYLLFNVIFWITAITEYLRPAEEYINNDDKATFQ